MTPFTRRRPDQTGLNLDARLDRLDIELAALAVVLDECDKRLTTLGQPRRPAEKKEQDR